MVRVKTTSLPLTDADALVARFEFTHFGARPPVRVALAIVNRRRRTAQS
jgi:hypothetical protein